MHACMHTHAFMHVLMEMICTSVSIALHICSLDHRSTPCMQAHAEFQLYNLNSCMYCQCMSDYMWLSDYGLLAYFIMGKGGRHIIIQIEEYNVLQKKRKFHMATIPLVLIRRIGGYRENYVGLQRFH